MKNINLDKGIAYRFDKIFKAFLWILMFVYCISMLIPIVWMLFTSLKDNDEFILNTFGLPKSFLFQNYSELFDKFYMDVSTANGIIRYGFFSMVLYSIIWAFIGPLLSLFFTVSTAYVLSKFNRFRFIRFLYSLGIFVMIFPVIGSGASLMYVYKQLGVYNNMLLMILKNPTMCFYGTNFLIMYSAFKNLSWSYVEAVYVDGGNNFTAYFKVMLPMVLPSCAVLYVLSALLHWNDYITFLMYLPSYPNLSYGLYLFQYNAAFYMIGMPVVMAGFAVTMIPAIILFASSQKLIMSKFTLGGLKG